jgi:superfamily II DNA or RNA helicase
VVSPNNIPSKFRKQGETLVESQCVPFFDFFRDYIFGFVFEKPGSKRGYYLALKLDRELDDFETFCRCDDAPTGLVCGHGAALYLKSMNWPMDEKDLTLGFEAHPLTRFFQTVGKPLQKVVWHAGDAPKVQLEDDDPAVQRYFEYLGFVADMGRKAERDRKALDQAKRGGRSTQEKTMLKKGFPSARTLFEESSLYPLCKLLFFLDLRHSLRTQVRLQDNHVALIQIAYRRKPLFEWSLSVQEFIKGFQKDRDFWIDRCDFEVQKQSLPVLYQIRFNQDNDLEILPSIEIGSDHFEPSESLLVQGSKSLYFHEKLGYFQVQTGLSMFDMTYSSGLSVVPQDRVAAFLKEYRGELERFDRRLIDKELFEEVVTTAFGRFKLLLTDFTDGHFHFELQAQLGEVWLDFTALCDLFNAGRRYVKVAGKLFDTTGFDAVYLKPLCEIDKGQPMPAAELVRFMSFFKTRLQVQTNQLTETVFEQLRDFKPPPLPTLEATKLSLRSYQEIGFGWLYTLRHFGLGGLLCDQMGLGKTHQAMAMMAAVMHENPKANILVVAPYSVIFHWQEKLRRFCPDFKVYVHHGGDRNLNMLGYQGYISLTTFSTLRRDAKALGEKRLDLLVFDEIQNLKNKSTIAFREIRRVKARTVIGLTGTPIENRVEDLKALMDLALPGFLGPDPMFKRYFADPIQKFDNEHARKLLINMTKPFMLRRRKDEVLLELPEKIEDVRAFKLSEYEMELYKKTKAEGMNAIHSEESQTPKYLQVFTLIGKLKMLVNHPALFFGTNQYQQFPSTKWELFRELVAETMDSGQKLVVFTQYLGMIEMFQRYFNDLGIEYATIQGSTKDRAGEQQRFQTNPNCRVFIGSINAAGTGIDLTEGSVLIHYDRWWNPAREEQATDRIHRIGQRNAVQIYKFMAEETIEERIQMIIEKKRALLENLVEYDASDVSKSLSLNDLLEILA